MKIIYYDIDKMIIMWNITDLFYENNINVCFISLSDCCVCYNKNYHILIEFKIEI